MSIPPLAEIIRNRSWIRNSRPFPHVIAHNVFTVDFYRTLHQAFGRVLARGVSEGRATGRLSRNIVGYDAYGLSLDGRHPEFAIFLSRAWHDVLAGLFDVEATGHINCGLHHHAPGSKDGWVHNDLNPGWFAELPTKDGIVPARHGLCNYTDGTRARPDILVTRVVRAVAMIFYLGNGPSWTGIEGGTGLYETWDRPVRKPDALIRPVDNSLLAFECTPLSFHSFIGSNQAPRNSVIMWLHRPMAEAVARWGERCIRMWPPRQRG
jgi:hypothetical protein